MKPIRTGLSILTLLFVACGRSQTVYPTSTPLPTPTFSPARFGSAEVDITYCTMDGQPQKMDVYFPSSGGPWPALVYVHGGAWMKGDKSEGEGWRYLNDYGYLVISVNYRLATHQIKFPAMIEDVKCAIRYLRAHAAEYHLDPNRIAALGVSAGGHLVALLGTADKTAGWEMGEYLDQSSGVQAVISIAGIFDLSRAMYRGLNASLYYVFGELTDTSTLKMVAASPISYVTPDDPPFLIFHGDKDSVVPVAQAETLHRRLSEAGVPSRLVIVHNGDHGLQGQGASPSWNEVSNLILEFLQEHLK